MRSFPWTWTLSSHILELSFRLLCKHNKRVPHSRTLPGTEACPMEMQILGWYLWIAGEMVSFTMGVFEKNAQKTAKTSKQIKDTLWHWNFKCSRNLARYCCWTSVPLDLQSCHWQRPSGTALTSQGPPSQDRSAHSPNPRPHPSWQSYSGTRWNLGKWRADLDKVHSIAAIQKNTRKPTARTGLLLVVPSRKSQYLPGAATCRKLGARQWQIGEQQLWQPWSGTCCDILPTQCFLIIWSFKYLQTILVILDHFSLYVYSRAACPACPEAVPSWSTNSGRLETYSPN